MTRKVRTAIFPVAGMGTRFLPATKSVPKEMLPLVDRPLIQYAIDEARAAGIREFIFVTARGKSALEDYFDSSPALERVLADSDKQDLLDEVQRATMPSGAIAYIRQQEALGLGHAVWCARRLVGDQPFAVILPDDVISASKPCLQQMVEAFAEQDDDCSIVATMEVEQEATRNYGVLDPLESAGRMVRARGLIEKPAPEQAPSRLAVIGRYILTPEVMDSLGQKKKGAGGEIQLTDAIAEQASRGRPVYGFRFDGERFDCGSKIGFLKANIAFALARDDLGPELSQYLRGLQPNSIAAE